MTIKILSQASGQDAQHLALSSLTKTTVLKATPGMRVAIESAKGDIASMTRSGDTLLINTADGKTLQVDDFFGPASRDMKSLTLTDTANGEKTYILGDEKLYADNAPVTAYTPEELRSVVSSEAFYQQPAQEGAETSGAKQGDDDTAMWLALGLGGVALVAGGIAIYNHNNDDDNDHHTSNKGGGNHDDNNLVPPAPVASELKLDLSNGQCLSGSTDTPKSIVYIDTTGDGQANYTAICDENGKWSVPVCEPSLADGQTVTAWTVDQNGNDIKASINIDYASPELSTVNVSSDLTELFGAVEAGATVKLDLDGDGEADYTTVADADGQYRFKLENGLVSPGRTTVTIADNVANTTTLLIPALIVPVLLGLSETADGAIQYSSSTTATTPTLRGLGEAGSEVQIMSDGEVVGKTTVDAEGNWQITLQELPEGEHTFDVVRSVVQQADASTGAEINTTINMNTGSESVNVVEGGKVLREIATNEAIETTQSLTRATPDGGYVIAYAEAESAGSPNFDLKLNFYNAAGQLVGTAVAGLPDMADGYNATTTRSHLNNFDIAVSPVDGSVTVFYVQSPGGETGYLSSAAVYQQYTAEGVEITHGPQVVVEANDLGGMGAALDTLLGQNASNWITNTLDTIWQPIKGLISPLLPGIDFDKLEVLFTDGLFNRLGSALYGAGTLGAKIVQMEDGSMVFVGSKYFEGLDTASLVDRVDVVGFVDELLTDIGILNGGNLVSGIITTLYNGLKDIILQPIESIIDQVLTWVDINTGTAGSQVFAISYQPDGEGHLVANTDYEYAQTKNLFSCVDENGYLVNSDHDDLIGKFTRWVFGDSVHSTSDSLGLDATQIGDNLYAVVWQQAYRDDTLNELFGGVSPKIKLTMVDSTTGQHIGTEIQLSGTGVAPKVIQLADGSLLVSWVNLNNTDAGDIYAQRIAVKDGEFVSLTNVFQINSQSEGTQGLIEGTMKEAWDMVALDNGGFMTTWTSTLPDGSQHLQGQAFDMLGLPVGTEFTLADSAAGSQINDSSVTLLKDGGVVVSWSETDTDAGSSHMMHMVINSDGTLRPIDAVVENHTGDQIVATEDSAVVHSTDADDTIYMMAPNGEISAGEGNDRLLADTTMVHSVDGGKGFDTLVVTNAGLIENNPPQEAGATPAQTPPVIGHEDLAKLSGIDNIDLNGRNGSNTLELSYEDVLSVSDSGKLIVNGGSTDKVDLDLNQWQQVAVGVKDGAHYNIYAYEDDQHAQAWIQNNMQVI